MPFSIELKVPPETAYRSLVRQVVSDAAERAGVAGEGIVSAAEAGFTTIVESAMAETREAIRLLAQCTPEHLRVSLFEHGLPLDDAAATRDPRWPEIAQHVDSAHWHLHGKAGSELELRVVRPHDGAFEATPAPNADVPQAPEQTYEIRRFVPADAPGIARAFYLTYGYHYVVPAVYVPARLTELNAQGRYVSIVAVAQNGEIAAHYALVREPGAPIAEGGGAIVTPAHRGRNLLNLVRAEAERVARSLGLAAYFTEPVTDHARTQHASITFGAKACGIMLGSSPKSFLATHMDLSNVTQRQSTMFYVKPLHTREPRAVYVPARHREMVQRIYAQLEVPVEIADGGTRNARGNVRVLLDRGDGIATVEVDAIGEQTAGAALQAVDDLRALQHVGAIYVSIPLHDPGAPELCDVFERRGFFFSGIAPWCGADGGDALRLQRPLTPIDLGALTIAGDFGQELVAYVAQERERAGAPR